MPFRILLSKVFYWPKKFQKKKMHFGLFLNPIWMPRWSENTSEIIVSMDLERVAEALTTGENCKQPFSEHTL